MLFTTNTLHSIVPATDTTTTTTTTLVVGLAVRVMPLAVEKEEQEEEEEEENYVLDLGTFPVSPLGRLARFCSDIPSTFLHGKNIAIKTS